MTGYRCHADVSGDGFARDTIRVFLGEFGDGVIEDRKVRVFDVTLTEVAEGEADAALVSNWRGSELPREVCEVLHAALGHVLTGVDDPVAEIARLRRDLAKAERRIDGLIAGMSGLEASAQ